MGSYSSKNTTSYYHQLDIRYLRQHGMLTPGRSFSLNWSRMGEVVGSLGVQVEFDRIILNYRHQRYGEDWKSYEYPIFLDHTPCHYGGTRSWFVCPSSICSRRVAVLHGGRLFACRHCHQLVYESQREAPWSRALTRLQKIRERLGGTGSMAEDFPGKPKGMHWRTYKCLCMEAGEAQNRSWSPLMIRMLATSVES